MNYTIDTACENHNGAGIHYWWINTNSVNIEFVGDLCTLTMSWNSSLKLGQFTMPKTCENKVSIVNICVYFARQTCGIYQVLPCSVDFEAPGELWSPLIKAIRCKCSFFFRIKDLYTPELTANTESNFYVESANIFLILTLETNIWLRDWNDTGSWNQCSWCLFCAVNNAVADGLGPR